MDLDLVLRTVSLCLALAGVETLHGIARTVWLVPRVGKAWAQRLGMVSGSALALGVCAWLVPGVGLVSLQAHLWLGLVLALFMAGFDLALGHWVLRRRWSKAFADLNPATGNWLLWGLVSLTASPALVWWWGVGGFRWPAF